MITLDDQSTSSLNIRAKQLNEEGSYQEAIKNSNQAIELDPNNQYAYINKSYALYKQGRFADALEECDMALNLAPDLKIGLLNRAGILGSMGKYEEALDDCNRVLESDPWSKNALFNKGLIYEKKGELQKAKTFYNKSLDIDQRFSAALEGSDRVEKLLKEKEENSKKIQQIRDEIISLKEKERMIDTRAIERALDNGDIKKAEELLSKLNINFNAYQEVIEELKKLDGRQSRLAEQLADEKIDMDIYRDAIRKIDFKKHELIEKEARLRNKVIYEDYQKPF